MLRLRSNRSKCWKTVDSSLSQSLDRANTWSSLIAEERHRWQRWITSSLRNKPMMRSRGKSKSRIRDSNLRSNERRWITCRTWPNRLSRPLMRGARLTNLKRKWPLSNKRNASQGSCNASRIHARCATNGAKVWRAVMRRRCRMYAKKFRKAKLR